MKSLIVTGIALAAASLLTFAGPGIAAAAELNLDNHIVLQKTDTSQIAAPDDHPSPADLIIMVDTDLTLGSADFGLQTIGIDDIALAAAAPNISGNPTFANLEKMTLGSGARHDFQSSSGGFASSMVFLTNLTTGADFGLASGALSSGFAT